MHHGAELTTVLVVTTALLVGAATRALTRRTAFPYTSAVLLAGVAFGLSLDAPTTTWLGAMGEQLRRVGAVSPDMIIFVFLPALLFESAFGMESYTFRKNLGGILLFALPAMLLNAVLAAALIVRLTAGGWAWGWTEALLFSVLISATDPVAVVAVLKDLGVSKRLRVLIEGESLFNDGTAIVAFGAIVALVTGEVGSLSVGGTTLDFLRITLGGLLLGLASAALLGSWIGRTFNDPLVEISLTLALAYAAMILAEAVFHVSGVIAVVTAGLWMGGRGRTRISPEVHRFLQRFWRLMAYVANTLIFFLVGVIIAVQLSAAAWRDLLMIPLIYAVIMVVRLAVIVGFGPLARKVGPALSTADLFVVSWAGLRGAVSLALALVVSQLPGVPEELRSRILLLTAGVVLLTILINGTTMPLLLRRLGLHRRPPATLLAEVEARRGVLTGVANRLDELRNEPDLRTVGWDDVLDDLDRRGRRLQLESEALRDELEAAPVVERELGLWKQALNVERVALWEAFSDGTLGAAAMRALNREIDHHIDGLAEGRNEPPDERVHRPGEGGLLRRALKRSAVFRTRLSVLQFDRLALLYDMYRGAVAAAEQVLATGELFARDEPVARSIRTTYKRYLLAGKEGLEEMRHTMPEITSVIETRLARRIALNLERDGYSRLAREGVLSKRGAQEALSTVEERMKRLKHGARSATPPPVQRLLGSLPVFASLDDEALEELGRVAEEVTLSPDEYLYHRGETDDALYVIARGAAHVLGETELLDIRGGGDMVGEMALLTGRPAQASIRAATPLTLIRIDRDPCNRVAARHPELLNSIWRAFIRHSFDALIRQLPEYAHMSLHQRLDWIDSAEQAAFDSGMSIRLPEGTELVFLARGSIRRGGERTEAPSLLRGTDLREARALEPTRLVLLSARDLE